MMWRLKLVVGAIAFIIFILLCLMATGVRRVRRRFR